MKNDKADVSENKFSSSDSKMLKLLSTYSIIYN